MSNGMPEFSWAIGGGKGGVGKSFVTLSLAYWFGRLQRRVIVMDGDLGGANLHTMMGHRIPERTLDDFILRRVEDLNDVLLPTNLPNVQLLAGGSEIPALANPNHAQKTRIVRGLQGLQAEALLLDLGAGVGLNTLDFFLACPHKLIVVTPQPTSIQNAYGFVKAALFRRIGRVLSPTSLKGLLEASPKDEELPPSTTEEVLEEVEAGAPEVLDEVRAVIREHSFKIVVNMSRDSFDLRAGQVIQDVCRRFLMLEAEVVGAIPHDARIDRWSATMDLGTLLGKDGEGGALQPSYEIAYRLLSQLPAAHRPDGVESKAA